MSVRELLTFPNPVNEKAARSVAGGVVVLSLLTLVTQWWWLAALLALGFALRVAGGPRYSPLGRLAVHVIAPRFGEARLVPGPPKRFAQTVGLLFSGGAAIALAAGATTLATVLLAVLVVFALLESALGFCAGCWVFGHLMRLGVIPEETCVACNDIRLRQPQATNQPA
ncbi:major facilitator superfamily permease [Janibacter sp. HTCC2649]|uniref:DUF4395 domain-containing protein n=1 Tax=Janibacter sp. HTCC2649 TaxID=313589 RepID=UPI00006711A3|nr:DUF4395 domain-containing protein [Janibacter sp. HTCC2649]EAP97065.1 major facilitator superfamily permease [Janibacter sp. HTCC2649]